VFNEDVIRPTSNPIYGEGSLAVLKGNLAPDGCVIKPAAMDQRFMKHTGPAVVFDDYPSMKKAVADENWDITADHVMVLRNAGPQGGPGMPEWGMLPMPTKLLKEGHRDMLRMSDARMSGTSYGACVLHVAPESFVGGPLALLQNGDMVTIDVPARSIRMEVSDEELARRRAAWKKPEPRYERGLRNQMVQGALPLSPPKGGSMVGEAYTLRYIPAREDLNPMTVFRNHAHPQRKAVEECPAGAVMVIDSRKDARAASAGAILATRLMVRGCA